MTKRIKTNFIFFVLILVLLSSCVEEIDLNTEVEFESALVVEATITDQFKHQLVKLSRTYMLEDEGPDNEQDANVIVTSSCGQSYTFQEDSSGYYISQLEFAAQSNCDYYLEIITSDGRKYKSHSVSLTQETQIDDLYALRDLNENGDEGVSIYLDTSDPSGNSTFYRFEYEETYKIVAPQYSPLELEILNNDFYYPPGFLSVFSDTQEVLDFFFELRLREEQEQICYNTVNSNNIILANTTNFNNDTLEQFRVRFLGRENTIISHRYSILVRQYVQSQQAHAYYTALSDLSENESILSETQPGFFQGNMMSISNPDEKVIGFFELSAVDEKRIFFNYQDLFPQAHLPPYYINCDDTLAPIFLVEDFAHNITHSPIIEALTIDFIFYEDREENKGSVFAIRPYDLVFRGCGDCTVYGDNTIPDFWED